MRLIPARKSLPLSALPPLALFSLVALAATPAWAAVPAPPAYDHIVVVVEENESYGRVIGDTVNANYINNTLVAGGVSFNNFYAITHPSQPNYLEMFSGSNQGNTNDSVPVGQPFTTPNLAAALGAGNFVGYSEDLPSPGSNVTTSGLYARKHAPWTNWQGTGTNQLNGTQVSRPFFGLTGGSPDPTKPFYGDIGTTTTGLNYAALPKVTFVIPNLINDMHDGSYPGNIQAGDNWLRNNLSGYAEWAKAHNSLLVVTFDEDNSSGAQANKIPTIFYGANLNTGAKVDTTYTLHNLLRTVEDTYGANHSGMAANVKPVVGAFAGQSAPTVVQLRKGANNYTGVHDTMLQSDQPNTAGGSLTSLTVDTLSTTNGVNQVLIRFDDLGSMVPAGATVISAKLVVKANNGSVNNTLLYRMTHGWSEASTWSDVNGDGVADAQGGVDPGSDTLADSSFTLDAPYLNNMAIFDVTDTVQAWLDGTAANYGWALLPTGSDGFAFNSSEAASDMPMLEIAYAVPEPASAGLLALGAAALLRRRR